MDEITKAVASHLDAIEEHGGEITDRELARRLAIVRVRLEGLQLNINLLVD